MSGLPVLRIVIGFSPGSASDDIARLIAAPLGKQLGQAVAIERIAGDNGALAARAVAQSAADGNTLLVATLGTHALAPHVHNVRNDLPYHPINDFAPVSLLTQSPMLLACHPALPVNNINEFITHARARPAALAYGTSATGGAPHLAAELFQSVTGVTLRHALYDDTQKLYADLEAGRIALSFNNIMSMLPRCNAGTLRALGVTATQRSPVAPHIPTLAECGVNGGEVSNWLGLVAPRGTPVPWLDTIAQAAAAAINSNEVAVVLNRCGITPCGSTPVQFGRFIASELTHWKPVVTRFSQV